MMCLNSRMRASQYRSSLNRSLVITFVPQKNYCQALNATARPQTLPDLVQVADPSMREDLIR